MLYIQSISPYTSPEVSFLLGLRIVKSIRSQLMIGSCVCYDQTTNSKRSMLTFLKGSKVTIGIREKVLSITVFITSHYKAGKKLVK